MIKKRIGIILCALSAAAAMAVYILVMRYKENLLVLKNLEILGVYYPILFTLDVALLLYTILKRALPTKAGKPVEAAIFLLFSALNVFLAVKIYPLWEKDLYMPAFFIKAAGFAALYLMQAAFVFVKGKHVIRLLDAAALIAMCAAIYIVAQKSYGDNLGLFVNAYLSVAGKSWPEKYYWCTTFAVTAAEMMFALIRIIGLMLYDTKDKVRRLRK